MDPLARRKALKKMKAAREESGAELAPAPPADSLLTNTMGFGTGDALGPLEEIECPRCAEKIKAKAKECRFCNHEIGKPVKGGKPRAAASAPSQRHVVTTSSPGVAAVLSFFLPGLGQLYCGEMLLGFGLMIAWPAAMFAGGFVAMVGFVASIMGQSKAGLVGSSGLGAALFCLSLGMWIWSVFDAYNRAAKPKA